MPSVALLAGVLAVIGSIALMAHTRDVATDSFRTETEHPYVITGLVYMFAGITNGLLMYLAGAWAETWAWRNHPSRAPESS